MAQRRRRPVEPIELHWDKTEDLKELMRGYFPHAERSETPMGVSPPGISASGESSREIGSAMIAATETPTGVSPIAVIPAGAPGIAETGDLAPDALAAADAPTGKTPNPETPVPVTPIPLPPSGETEAGVPPVGVSPARAPRPHRCTAAHDAHTHSEEAVYQLLWRIGQHGESLDFRYSSISLKQLSERVRMDAKSTQALLRRLVDKLVIELAAERDNHRQTARVWKVYSPGALLERRRAAGFEWVVRNKGIHFVSPPPDPPLGETPMGDSFYGIETPVGVLRPPDRTST